jgi:hypothetical protein
VKFDLSGTLLEFTGYYHNRTKRRELFLHASYGKL